MLDYAMQLHEANTNYVEFTESAQYQCKLCSSCNACVHYSLSLWHMIISILQYRHVECIESTQYQCKLCSSFNSCVHYGLFLWHMINLLLQYMHVYVCTVLVGHVY
jgi:hypothetical protein